MSDLSDRRVLVTGAAGFIGSHLVDRLVALGVRVTALDNLSSGKLNNLQTSISEISFLAEDIRDLDAIGAACQGQDAIVHLAGQPEISLSVQDPLHDFTINAAGTYNVLHSARANEVPHLIYASTAAVYGRTTDARIAETHLTQPQSPYAASKLAGELYGFAFQNSYGVTFNSFRLFNVFGPRQRRSVIYDLLRRLSGRPESIEMLARRSTTRDFVYVADVVTAFVSALESPSPQGAICNMGTGSPTTLGELVDLTVDLLGLTGLLRIAFAGSSWAGDLDRVVADVTRLREEFGLIPSTDLRSGIRALANDLDLLEIE